MAQRYDHISCDLCDKSDFKTFRYKCLTCQDFDLCGFCFERHKEIKDHKLSHLMFQFNASKIFNATEIDEHANLNLDFLKEKFKDLNHMEKCEICLNKIKGIKLKCDICFDYYQCIDCFEKKNNSNDHIKKNHPMIVCNDTAIELDISRLNFLKNIGKGGYGTVDLNEYKQNDKKFKIAVKKIVAPNDRRFGLLTYWRELDVHKQIKGENILQMIGNCISDNTFYIATEYIQKGSLRDVFKDKNFGLFERFKVAFGMICGIDRMHKNGFVHRDIKPDNVLITEDYCAKIADFGIAKIIQEVQTKQKTIFSATPGTYPYMVPEFFKYFAAVQLGEHPELTIDELKKFDIFASGLTILEIFYGTHERKNPLLAYSYTNPIVIEQDPKYFKKLILKCVDFEPSNRPTISQILDYLIVLNDFIQFLRSGKLKDLDSKNFQDKTEIMEESCELFEKENFSI